jgi:hypothetical protein
MKTIKDNPLTSYLRHAIVVILMQITADKLPADQLPQAVEYIADAVVLALYWAVVKYGLAFCRNRVLPFLDRLTGTDPNDNTPL